jgi:hypothetical protein
MKFLDVLGLFGLISLPISLILALVGEGIQTHFDNFSCNADHCVETSCNIYVPWLMDDDGVSSHQHSGWSKGPCSCSVTNSDGTTLQYCSEMENHPIRYEKGIKDQANCYLASLVFILLFAFVGILAYLVEAKNIFTVEK